jgi:head-tail adaptor
MRGGRKGSQVTIEQSTPSQSDSGQLTDSWSTYKTLWMEIAPIAGRETARSRQVLAEADSFGRYDWLDAPAVTPRMRVVYGTRIFDILHVANHRERGFDGELQLRERNP